ncbi:uncharacterized protein PODANS_4_3940 [Podospora anserina S mat+]|uniref:Podospora anserina S mat+ genomic DNA chromosome 4, supercontig 4 n=1 Tax=Podospora anserina (strain S / ATCC MYA-4624 / DSM 980 / FGSC 10383) TaxID=515849 RepID=B2AQJ4_PODAN|nr:uncharacterized protein PODANS_4_3940 [Podospora anserina S mat+]CAP66421.1 unnamed protein product [Podospora anserina S mat+]CDP28149.1 Putative protein of unknown function [Podospora anserina S mat+]
MPTSCKGNRPLTSGAQNREIGAQTLKDVRQIKDMSYQTKHISRQARDTADQTKRMTSKLQSDVQKNGVVACQTQATVLNIESQLKKLIKASRAPSPGRQFADWVPPLVRTLLLNGESVDKRQLPNRYTALQNACSDPDQSDNKIALVSFLLDEGADPRLTTEGAQSTSLHLAAYNNNVKALKAIKRSLVPEDDGPADAKTLAARATKLPVFTKEQEVTTLPRRPSTSMSTVSTVQRYRRHKKEWKSLLCKANKNGRNVLHMVAWGAAPEAAEFLVSEIVRERLSERLVREQDDKGRTPWDVLSGKFSRGDKDERAFRKMKTALEKAGAHLAAAQEKELAKEVQAKALPQVDEQHEGTKNASKTTPRQQPRRSPPRGRSEVRSPQKHEDRGRNTTPDSGQRQNDQSHLKYPDCRDDDRSLGKSDSRRGRSKAPTKDASQNRTNRQRSNSPQVARQDLCTNKISSHKVTPDTGRSDKAAGDKQKPRKNTPKPRGVHSSQMKKPPPSRDTRAANLPPPVNQRSRSPNTLPDLKQDAKCKMRPVSSQSESQKKPKSRVSTGEVRKSTRSAGWDTASRYGAHSEKRGAVRNKKDLGGDLWNQVLPSKDSLVEAGPQFGQMLQTEPLIKKWLDSVPVNCGFY